jgi:hypothetical protein
MDWSPKNILYSEVAKKNKWWNQLGYSDVPELLLLYVLYMGTGIGQLV